MNTANKLLLILAGIVLLSFTRFDSADITLEKIETNFDKFESILKPQKVYLHIDKPTYYAGENIWFQAFVLDATTHMPDTLSDHVYVELINPFQNRAQILRLRLFDGFGYGSFSLLDTVPEGVYQIRAFTNWMRNTGPEYFFNRHITVYNQQQQTDLTPDDIKNNKKQSRKLQKRKDDYTLRFFPEGGNLLAGINSKIAFKAEDGFGNSVSVKGVVIDANKQTVAQFGTAHKGMGTFNLTPATGEKYTALIEFPDNEKQRIALPEAMKNGVNFSVSHNSEKIMLSFHSNKPASNDRPANEMAIVGHVDGKIYHLSSINLLDEENDISISKTDFPTGIINFLMINNRLQVVAERLVFVNHNQKLEFKVKEYPVKDSLMLAFYPQFKLQPNEVFFSSLSVVVYDEGNSPESNENIFSELYLSSNLPGIIEEPGYYLQSNGDSVSAHLDLLMLTHGWKKFDWGKILNEGAPYLVHERERGITLMGKITRELLEIPLSDADVKLQIRSSYNDEYATVTNKKGVFYFNNLYYEDTIDVKLIARKQNGGKNLVIHLEEDNPKELPQYSGDFFFTSATDMKKSEYRRQQSAEAKQSIKKRNAELDSIFADNIYGRPDYVLWGKDFPPGQSNLLEAMKGRVPGMTVKGNSATIRGQNSILMSNNPLVLIDGVPTDFSVLQAIPPNDVERIDILKGASTAMYGSRGANGVIAIYTKRGVFMIKGELDFSMLGYHVAEKFEMPSAMQEKEAVEDQQLPITIYWNPLIAFISEEALGITLPNEFAEKDYHIVIEGVTSNGRIGYFSGKPKTTSTN